MRRILALSLALALSACSIIDPASDDIPRKVLGEDLGGQVPQDYTTEGWMDDPIAELPDLVPDYRPAWWHEPHGAVVRGMDAATLLALMATDTPVNFEVEKVEGGGDSEREGDRDSGERVRASRDPRRINLLGHRLPGAVFWTSAGPRYGTDCCADQNCAVASCVHWNSGLRTPALRCVADGVTSPPTGGGSKRVSGNDNDLSINRKGVTHVPQMTGRPWGSVTP